MSAQGEMFGRNTAIAAAPYTARPPSPPAIMIPVPSFRKANEPMTCMPSYASVDPLFLSAADLEIITRNKTQEAYDSVNNWTYEDRRTAQPILDFLYLGPSSIARDKEFLKSEGITMLLAARDSRMAQARLMGVDRVARELGIHAEHIDVSGHQELIRSFPDAVRKINEHMLDVYRSQAVNVSQDADTNGISNPEHLQTPDSMVVDRTHFRRGKVLIFCETGNDRSAGIVIAYLMSVFGMDMIQACQFIQFRRFCVSLDEDMKFLLQTFEGILNAQKTVHRHQLHNNQLLTPASAVTPATANPATPQFVAALPAKNTRTKRGIEDTMDDDEDMGGGEGGFTLDRDRYTDRPAFVPFVDRG
ncbi:dual specificity phosphatase [Xylariales sp. AK1849]|nr:dual specificity phosphatase [Xylariales sp. AK1849]